MHIRETGCSIRGSTGNSPWSPSFLIYINDLTTVCKSPKANLFADDTFLYRHIAHDVDSTKLQEDLITLEDWESKWQMSFHREKCTVGNTSRLPQDAIFNNARQNKTQLD